MDSFQRAQFAGSSSSLSSVTPSPSTSFSATSFSSCRVRVLIVLVNTILNRKKIFCMWPMQYEYDRYDPKISICSRNSSINAIKTLVLVDIFFSVLVDMKSHLNISQIEVYLVKVEGSHVMFPASSVTSPNVISPSSVPS